MARGPKKSVFQHPRPAYPPSNKNNNGPFKDHNHVPVDIDGFSSFIHSLAHSYIAFLCRLAPLFVCPPARPFFRSVLCLIFPLLLLLTSGPDCVRIDGSMQPGGNGNSEESVTTEKTKLWATISGQAGEQLQHCAFLCVTLLTLPGLGGYTGRDRPSLFL